MVYGWMPRALQIDSSRLDAAADDLERVAGAVRYHEVNIRALTDCLHSVVGASKLAHFVNPGVFPIWDRKVEGFRIGKREPSHYHMGKLSNYERYCREILELTAERDFPDFASRMDEALRARLAVLGISAYSVSALRSIDIAIFETVSANAPGLRATIPGKR